MNLVKDSVRREIVVHAPLNKVWDALTKVEHLNRWYTKESDIDFRVGGKGYMNHGWGSTSEGVYLEITPMSRFVMQGLDGDFTTITELAEVEPGVKVSIEYQASFLKDLEQAAKENMLFGTGQFLENLKSVYETGIDNRKNLWKTWIGISHTSNEENNGTKVLQVKNNTSAEKAGLLPGDEITKIDQENVSGYETFERIINKKSIGQPVEFSLQRGEKEMKLVCIVEEYPVAY